LVTRLAGVTADTEQARLKHEHATELAKGLSEREAQEWREAVCRYTVVTLLSHCCHTAVTLLSHCCYTVVALAKRLSERETQEWREAVGLP
jgi:hypothetical protein